MTRKGKRTLIIGRERSFLDGLRKRLRHTERDVSFARNVGDIYGKPFLEPFEVVIADLDSFGDKSEQILNYLRVFQSKALIITIIPRKDTGEWVRKFLGREADHYLEKPVSVTMLEAFVDAI